jgi:hypothetical protein
MFVPTAHSGCVENPRAFSKREGELTKHSTNRTWLIADVYLNQRARISERSGYPQNRTIWVGRDSLRV